MGQGEGLQQARPPLSKLPIRGTMGPPASTPPPTAQGHLWKLDTWFPGHCMRAGLCLSPHIPVPNTGPNTQAVPENYLLNEQTNPSSFFSFLCQRKLTDDFPSTCCLQGKERASQTEKRWEIPPLCACIRLNSLRASPTHSLILDEMKNQSHS